MTWTDTKTGCDLKIGTFGPLVGVMVLCLALVSGTAAAQDRFDFGGNPFGSSLRQPGNDRDLDRDERAGRSLFGALRSAEPATLGGEITIKWRVANPFRFFEDPQDTDLHRKTFEELTPEQRRDPILAAERTLGEAFRYGWAAELNGGVCWDQKTNLHRCKRNDDYMNPVAHQIVASLEGLVDANLVSCVWTVSPNGRNRRRVTSGGQPSNRGERHTQTSGGRKTIRQPCDQPAKLAIPYPSGATVDVRVGKAVVAKQTMKVEDLLVVGVGDSFGSGEGNPDVPVRFDPRRKVDYGAVRDVALAGYPARVGAWNLFGDRAFQRENAKWLDQACHRSLYSHQLRAALQLAIEQPHRAVTFLHLSCSGAEITRGLFLRYKGHEWVPNPPDFSQISAIARAQCGPRSAKLKDLPEAYHMRGKIPTLEGHLRLYECDRRRSRKIDLMFVSIGGNDVGFARLVANAVLPEKTFLKRLGGWFGQVHDRHQAESQLVELRQRYKAFKRALHYILHIPWSESDRVILTAYPAMALLEDGRTTCPSGKAGMEVFPVFRLSQSRAADSQKAADKLHAEMRAAARRYGWSFAQYHRDQFIGRGLCAGYDEVSLSTVDDLRFPRFRDGRWRPFNPADYRPYAPRQRWFRTPNDAYLTGHFHVASSLLQGVLRNRRLNWAQVMLASTYSGAFHPTAEGHAAIADGVAREARRVLSEYDGTNRIK